MKATETAYAAFALGFALLVAEAGRTTPMGYELYSWRVDTQWAFCILYNTSREKAVEEVFSKKTLLLGVDQLERRIGELPNGATIFWMDRLPSGSGPKAKGSEGLQYPTPDIVERVKRYAADHHIKIEVLGP